MKAIQYKIVGTEAERKAAHAIREAVFITEQGIPVHLVKDGTEGEGVLVVAVLPGGEIIATGKLTRDGNSKGVLARIAVSREYRGLGAGAGVIIRLEGIAREMGLESLSLKPHQFLEDFYHRLGYRTVAGFQESAGDWTLILMEKRLE